MSSETKLAPETSETLKLARVVPWWMLIPWLIGGVTGGDFFMTNEFIASQAGPLTHWGYLFAGLFIVVMSFVYWELISTYPYTGGEYVFLSRALGKFPGYIIFFVYAWNFVFWIPLNISVAGTYLYHILGGVGVPAWAWSLGLAILFHWVAYRGIYFSTVVQVVMSVIAILGITLTYFVPMLIAPSSFLAQAAVQLPLSGGIGGNLLDMMAVAGLCITFMVGFEVVPLLAEEINAPPKQFGFIQTTGSLGMSMVQALSALGFIAIVPLARWAELSGGEIPIPVALHEVAPNLFPVWLVKVLLATCMVSGFSTILTAITGFSRGLYALARDYRLPEVFARLHPKYKSPVGAIILSFGMALLGSFQRWVVDYAFALVLATMFMYILIPIVHIILRKKEPDKKRPVHTPFYPWINIIAFCWAIYMLWYQARTVPISVWYFLAVVLVIGLLVYLWSDKRRTQKLKEMGVTEHYGLPV